MAEHWSPQGLDFIRVHVESINATWVSEGLEFEEPLIISVSARADWYCAIARHFYVFDKFSWCLEVIDFDLLGCILKIVKQHHGSIFHRLNRLKYILRMLWHDIDPVFECRLLEVKFHDFVQR